MSGYLPYGRQTIDQSDIDSVVEVLRSDWLTTGPKVAEFEQAFGEFCGAEHAVAVCNGTAALHAIMAGIRIAPGDEVIVPAITFAATANSVVYLGGTPVFADVDPGTLLIDPASVKTRVTKKAKAIAAVDYAGQPCDYDALRAIADEHGLFLVADACHSPGATYHGRRTGTLADVTAFSFHPVKHITTGEGGMSVTQNEEIAHRMRIFRNHGITTDSRQREVAGAWYYEMVTLGFNYRLTDIQCVLGISQLKKLPQWIARRQEIARQYNEAFATIAGVNPLSVGPDVTHAYHLYVVAIDPEVRSRDEMFTSLRAAGIGVNVHYVPVHLHPFYRERFGTAPGLCPVAESRCLQILSLPIFPAMSNSDVEHVVATVEKLIA